MAREPDVAHSLTASGSLHIFLKRLLRINFFLQFSICQTTKPSATPEVALTVRSMLLKRKFRHLPLIKIVGFA